MPAEHHLTKIVVKVVKKARVTWLRGHGTSLPPPHLTAKQRAEVEECFALLDKNNSGVIDKHELVAAFREIGLCLNKAAMAEFMAQADPDQSGTLNHAEFVSIMGHALVQQSSLGVPGARLLPAGKSSLGFADAVRAIRRKRFVKAMMDGGRARASVGSPLPSPLSPSRPPFPLPLLLPLLLPSPPGPPFPP
ncbi:hypothetical protein V8C86DRAFT_355050 [Haematococcus lacustris]